MRRPPLELLLQVNHLRRMNKFVVLQPSDNDARRSIDFFGEFNDV